MITSVSATKIIWLVLARLVFLEVKQRPARCEAQQAAQEALSRIRATGNIGSVRIESVDFDNALSDYEKQRAERAKQEGE